MAYKAPQIYDEVTVGSDKYIDKRLSDGRLQLISSPDEVVKSGTPINRELLQPALNAIEAHDEAVANMPNDITSAIVNNPRGWVTHTITKAHLNSSNEYAIPVNGSRYAIYLPDEFSITTNMSLSTPDSQFYDDSWFFGIGSTGENSNAAGIRLGSLSVLMPYAGKYHTIGRRENGSDYAELIVYFESNAPVLKVNLSGMQLTSLNYTLYTMQI